MSLIGRRNLVRLLAVVVVITLFAPITTSAVTNDGIGSDTADADTDADSLVMIAAQGDDVGNGKDSRILIVNPETRETVWQTSKHPTYFDVDPLNETTILYSATNQDGESFGVVQNWRTDEIYSKFRIANGTHDIDSLGDGRYVYVDGSAHRVVVIDRSGSERRTVWTYDFTDRFPSDVGGGNPNSYAGDYTHLNDVDSVDNKSAFLVSPRNFDRVMLLNRPTKTIQWTLGEEDNYDILFEQHNPNLISRDPPTVLVADSENDRIVEYRRTDSGWELVWEYDRNLEWPRDADRLPNGNTLLLDSRFVMEVTPSREVVWKMRVSKFPYDAEKISLGDEPGGPPMTEFRGQFGSARMTDDGFDVVELVVSPVNEAYQVSRWVLPFWVSLFDFVTAGAGVLVLIVWAGFEIDTRWTWGRNRLREFSGRIDRRLVDVLAVLVAVGGMVTLWTSIEPSLRFAGGFRVQWWRWDPVFHAVGILALLEGTKYGVSRSVRPNDERLESLLEVGYYGLAMALVVLGVGLVALTLGFGGQSVRITNPGALRALGIGVVVLGGRHPLRDLSFDNLATDRVRQVAVLGAFSLSVWVLVVGGSSANRPAGFLGIGLLLAVAGRTTLFRTAGQSITQVDHVAEHALFGAWYVIRVVVGLTAVATVLRAFGLGSITGITLSSSVLTPLFVTAVLLVSLEVVGRSGFDTVVR